ncbi:MAG: SIMPL domain-containing protein [Gemmatimonadaceae bacterium]
MKKELGVHKAGVPIFAVISLILAPVSAQAQDSIALLRGSMGEIIAVGHAEIKISPDRATIQISVETRSATAAAAATENAKKQQSVLTALKSLGLSNDQLSTVNYTVYPEQRYEQGKAPEVIAYTVTNTILADVRRLDQVGPVIDAALAHGANMIASLQFYASNVEVARRTAIAAAVEKARGDADAAAHAAHGTLGLPLEINVSPYSPPPPRPLMMAAAGVARAGQVETPINPGQETLSVDVSTRWRFVPTQ